MVPYFLTQFDVGPSKQVLLALTSSLCLAHQIHIASRSQYGKLGGLTNCSLPGSKFLSGIIGSAHIWASSRYFIPLFLKAVEQLHTLQFLLPVEAAALNICVLSDSAIAERVALLDYLLGRVLGKALRNDHRAATRSLCAILNTTSPLCQGVQPQYVHVCSASCTCGGRRDLAVQQLVSSLRTVMLRQPRTPSEERWTSVTPCLAYFAVWLFFGLGHRAMVGAFSDPGVQSKCLLLAYPWKHARVNLDNCP